MPTSGSLAVVGGGVIGLSVARRAALDGWAVRVHRTGERGASWVAGGMLAPHSEGWPGEERLLRLGLASLALWHDGFLDGLPADVVTARESLVVAVDRADAADLKTVGEWLAAQGHPVTLTIGRARHRTAAGARHSARLPSPKPSWPSTTGRCVEALAAHCERLGVQWAPPVTDAVRSRRPTRWSSPTASTRPRCGPACRSGR